MNSSTFINGPAIGVNLQLARSPRFLRAVQDADGTWNALDQVEDEPRSGEVVHVYERIGETLRGMADRRDGRGRRGGPFSLSRYGVLASQPPVEVVRDTAAWRAWCLVAATAPPAAAPATAAEAMSAVAEQFGLPDAGEPSGGRRRAAPPADANQGHLFGGRS